MSTLMVSDHVPWFLGWLVCAISLSLAICGPLFVVVPQWQRVKGINHDSEQAWYTSGSHRPAIDCWLPIWNLSLAIPGGQSNKWRVIRRPAEQAAESVSPRKRAPCSGHVGVAGMEGVMGRAKVELCHLLDHQQVLGTFWDRLEIDWYLWKPPRCVHEIRTDIVWISVQYEIDI